MAPDNPVLQAMAATPVAPGIHANSIIAVDGNGPVEGRDDGVVKYESSHLEDVDQSILSALLTLLNLIPTQSKKCTVSSCYTLAMLAPAYPAAICRHSPNMPIVMNSR